MGTCRAWTWNPRLQAASPNMRRWVVVRLRRRLQTRVLVTWTRWIMAHRSRPIPNDRPYMPKWAIATQREDLRTPWRDWKTYLQRAALETPIGRRATLPSL